MKKLNLLALSMLFSTGMIINAETQSFASKIATGLSDEQKAAFAQKKASYAAANPEQAAKLSKFQSMGKAEKQAALKNSPQAQAFQAMSSQDKKNAILSKYQSNVTSGTNTFTGNRATQAQTKMATQSTDSDSDSDTDSTQS